jgi:hypothetical protein
MQQQGQAIIDFKVPDDKKAGDECPIRLPSGVTITVVVPEDKAAGDILKVGTVVRHRFPSSSSAAAAAAAAAAFCRCVPGGGGRGGVASTDRKRGFAKSLVAREGIVLFCCFRRCCLVFSFFLNVFLFFVFSVLILHKTHLCFLVLVVVLLLFVVWVFLCLAFTKKHSFAFCFVVCLLFCPSQKPLLCFFFFLFLVGLLRMVSSQVRVPRAALEEAKEVLQFKIPEGKKAGDQCQVRLPSGTVISIQIPEGKVGG